MSLSATTKRPLITLKEKPMVTMLSCRNAPQLSRCIFDSLSFPFHWFKTQKIKIKSEVCLVYILHPLKPRVLKGKTTAQLSCPQECLKTPTLTSGIALRKAAIWAQTPSSDPDLCMQWCHQIEQCYALNKSSNVYGFYRCGKRTQAVWADRSLSHHCILPSESTAQRKESFVAQDITHHEPKSGAEPWHFNFRHFWR